MIRLGVLGSTKGTDLQAILDAISKKILKAKVSLVVSNNKNAYILKRAKNSIGSISCDINLEKVNFYRKRIPAMTEY